ncbi:MAG: hypothetical protein HY553_21025 [Elusimicrobia bacterium]|nr:hypothetical protein [Elusimicrobiota bacterium]
MIATILGLSLAIAGAADPAKPADPDDALMRSVAAKPTPSGLKTYFAKLRSVPPRPREEISRVCRAEMTLCIPALADILRDPAVPAAVKRSVLHVLAEQPGATSLIVRYATDPELTQDVEEEINLRGAPEDKAKLAEILKKREEDAAALTAERAQVAAWREKLGKHARFAAFRKAVLDCLERKDGPCIEASLGDPWAGWRRVPCPESPQDRARSREQALIACWLETDESALIPECLNAAEAKGSAAVGQARFESGAGADCTFKRVNGRWTLTRVDHEKPN